MIGFIIGSLLVLVIVFFSIRNALVEKKHRQFVEKNSRALEALDSLNRKYVFSRIPSLSFSYDYDNEKTFENVSCQDYLIYQLQNDPSVREKTIQGLKEADENTQKKQDYLKQVEAISTFGDFKIDPVKLKESRLLEIEKRLFRSRVKTPVTSFYCTVWLYRCSLSGLVYDKKTDVFGERKTLDLLKRIKNKSGRFFNDREIWDALCRVERGKVSNKLRFAVYERDGYRCRFCGRNDDEVNLEIDHIIPISKGGKSTLDNLQTLCHDCNVEKGNQV